MLGLRCEWMAWWAAALVMALAACGGEASTPAGGDADAKVEDAPEDAGDEGADGAPDDDGVVLDAGSDAGPDGESPPPDGLFSPDRVVEVSMELAAADWEALRHQRRSMVEMFAGDCQAAPHVSPYTYFPTRLTVDGVTVDPVGVRKKGWIGSQSTARPGFKLNLDEYAKGTDVFGYDDLVLNNSVQDGTYVKQCLGYALFAAAGVPAPRCGFAHVTVNGEDLGLYVMLEAVDKDFLKPRFANPSGNMYEGVLSDFREGWLGTFEPETNKQTAEGSDLAAVAAALEASDDALLASLEAVVDLDQFITFWAVESLIRHYDGYSKYANNYHVYRDPQTGRFVFIPHGIDAIMNTWESTQGTATSVYARAALSKRLLDHPEGRARYFARLSELLDTIWDEAALGAELDRLHALIAPHAGHPHGAGEWDLAAAFAELRGFISARRGQIEAELAAGDPASDPLLDTVCWPVVGAFEGSFSTTLGTLFGPPFGKGTGTFALTLDDQAVPEVDEVGATAGVLGGTSALIKLSARMKDGAVWRLELDIPLSHLAPGTLKVDWIEARARLLRPDGTTTVTVGQIAPGSVTLTTAGTADGATITGTITGAVSDTE